MITPKADQTIASNIRLSPAEAKALVEHGKKMGWLKVRPDAHVFQFTAKGNLKSRPADLFKQ